MSNNNMFKIESSEPNKAIEDVSVLTDIETGMQYIVVTSYNGFVAVTPRMTGSYGQTYQKSEGV